MTSTIDFALLSGASYNDTRSAINRFSQPQGWTLHSVVPSDKQTGFEARAFQSGSEIVISYSGTDPNNSNIFTSPDGRANYFLADGSWSDQLLQAAEYYLQVKAANPGSVVSLTGHSLGGGLAALVGVFFGVQASTFDQAPFAKSAMALSNNASALQTMLAARGYSSTQLAPLADYIQLRSVGGNNYIPRASLVSTVRVEGEFLDNGLLGYSAIGNVSLSGILCVRHTMSDRSMYAKQDEEQERGDRREVGGIADDPQGTA